MSQQMESGPYILVNTTDEFIRKARRGDRFAFEALEVGIPLYGKQLFNDARISLGKERQN
jgi:hypothetical protein